MRQRSSVFEKNHHIKDKTKKKKKKNDREKTTHPAMSVISKNAFTADLGLKVSTKKSKRSSGTLTREVAGSIVQKGKFSAGTPILVRTLNSVLLPTLGS